MKTAVGFNYKNKLNRFIHACKFTHTHTNLYLDKEN